MPTLTFNSEVTAVDVATEAAARAAADSSEATSRSTADGLLAPKANPTFTGIPAADTAAQGTNTTQLATAQFVQTEAGLLIPKSLVDAKGDLLVGTADNTVARRAVGADGEVLTADSAQATGVKWAAAAGGAPSGAAGGVLGGTYPNPGFAVDMATQAELDAVAAAAQPVDSDLTAIAALTTTSFGRAFLALADAAAGRTALGLGTAATQASTAFDVSGAAAAAQAASQPLDSDLTAIAALSTTAFGRALLALADAAALRTAAGTVIGTDVQAWDADLDSIAALATTSFGRSLLTQANAAAALATLGTDASSGTRTPTAHATTHRPGGTDALMSVKRANGTSASGTATTTVAEILADGSSQLVGWQAFAAQTNAASTQTKIIITYSDATTTTDTSVAASATTMHANAGGIERTAAGAHIANTPNSAKAVTGIRVETAGTGTGTRAAVISAIQVPL